MKTHVLAVAVLFTTIAGTAGTAAAASDAGDPNSEFDISYFYGAWYCQKDTETTTGSNMIEDHNAEAWVFKPRALGKWTSIAWVTFGGGLEQHGGGGLLGFDPSRGKLVETGACDLGGYGYAYSDGWQDDTLTFTGEGFNFEGADVNMTKAFKKVSETEFVVTWDVAAKTKSIKSHGSATCTR